MAEAGGLGLLLAAGRDEAHALRDGNYYALAPMEALGLSERGAVRAGFLHYTTGDEVDRLLEALSGLA